MLSINQILSVIRNTRLVVYIRTHQTSKNIDLPLRTNYCCGKHVNPLLNHKNLLLEVQICKHNVINNSIYDEIMNSDLSALNPI